MSPHMDRLPHQPRCVLPSLSHIHIPNQTFHRRRLTYFTAQLGMLRLVLFEPSSMKELTKALSQLGWPMKSFGSSQSSTCASLIHKLSRFVWNLGTPIESGWSLPSNWLTFEVDVCTYWLSSMLSWLWFRRFIATLSHVTGLLVLRRPLSCSLERPSDWCFSPVYCNYALAGL
jgi:hypothetical protein